MTESHTRLFRFRYVALALYRFFPNLFLVLLFAFDAKLNQNTVDSRYLELAYLE